MAYSISVNCTCGKILKIPEKYAGKRGRCPNCGQKISIPSLDEIKKKLSSSGTKEKEVRNCPTCGAYLNPGDVICVSCRTNLQTGEWDAEGNTYKEPAYHKVQYLGMSLVAAVLLMAVVFFVSSGSKTKDSDSTSLAITNPTSENKPTKISKLDIIKKMPEKTPEELEKKIMAFGDFLKKKVGEEHIQQLEAWQDKKTELEAEITFKKLNKNAEPFTRALQMGNFSEQYSATGYYSKALKEKEKASSQIENLVKKQRSEIENMIKEKKAYQALGATVGFLSELSQKYKISPQVSKDLETLAQLSEKTLANIQNSASETKEESQEQQQTEFLTLEQDINSFLSTYKRYKKEWKFHVASKEMEPLLQRALKHKSEHGENGVLKAFFERHEEILALNKMWTILKTKMKSIVGTTTPVLFLKDGNIITGVVKKYQDGKLYIKNKKKKQVVALEQIRAKYLIDLVKSVEKDADFQAGAAHFFLLEKEAKLALKHANNAISLEAEKEQLQHIVSWAQEEIQKDNQLTQGKKNLLAQRKAEREAKQRQTRLKALRTKGWGLVQKIAKEYKRGFNIKILEYLIQLQKILPRDEIIKLDSKLERRDGHSLAKIAEVVYEHCAVCKHVGTHVCPTCAGEGTILKSSGKTSVKKKLKGIKERCPKCKGREKVDCVTCKEKRDERKYKIVVDWYDDL